MLLYFFYERVFAILFTILPPLMTPEFFQFFPQPNIIAKIGPLTLYFYGAMYALGAIGGIYITEFFAKKRGIEISGDQITNIMFALMLGGVIGGRIFEILVYNLDFYLAHPADLLAVWKGGMSIHGGLIGGAIGFILACKKQKLRVGEISGIFMPALALGLMWGRLGNFVNGELYGRITEISWLGMDFHVRGDEAGTLRHPAQIYAMIKDFLIFLIVGRLLIVPPQKFLGNMQHGEIFILFLALYGSFRFVVEFFREFDAVTGVFFGFVSIGQILSLLVVAVAGMLWTLRKRIF